MAGFRSPSHTRTRSSTEWMYPRRGSPVSSVFRTSSQVQDLAIVDAPHFRFVDPEERTGFDRKRDRPVVSEHARVVLERLGVLERDELLVREVQRIARMAKMAEDQSAASLGGHLEVTLALPVRGGATGALLDAGAAPVGEPTDPPSVLLFPRMDVRLDQQRTVGAREPMFCGGGLHAQLTEESAHRPRARRRPR